MASTWFPTFSLPGLPSSVQKRFISFVLKRSLGHLVKPGQFDEQNIDAQIGNGFVEIKDIELDSDAVTALLGSLPIEFLSGSVAVVSVRIPWPNPFCSSIGLSLTKLRIKLRVSELPLTKEPTSPEDIAKSVANVAEEFIHDELSAKEASELRGSVISDDGNPDTLPGALDFSATNFKPGDVDVDVEGASLFAGLAENVLARFEFTASDIQVTLVDPNSSEVTLRVADISYRGESVADEISGRESGGQASQESRAIRISGVTLLLKDRSRLSDPPLACPARDDSMSRPSQSSDSEMDEETEMAMSQSLASLPPLLVGASLRPSSPSLSTISSAASSLYESAIGEHDASSQKATADVTLGQNRDTKTYGEQEEAIQGAPSQPEPPESDEVEDEVLLKFVDTISIDWSKISMPLPGPTSDTTDSENRLRKVSKVDLSMGTIAIALRPHHIRALLSLADSFPKVSDSHSSTPQSTTVKKAPLDAIIIALQLKGVVALLLGSSEDLDDDIRSIKHFFDRPLHPPRVTGGYIRVHLDGLEARKQCADYMTPALARRSSVGSMSSNTSAPGSQSEPQMSCILSDMSILVFRALDSSSSSSTSNLCSPILVVDPGLKYSYDSRYNHPFSDEEKRETLPSFGVIDWTMEQNQRHGASLRHWKQRPAHYTHGRRFSSGKAASVVSTIGLATSPPMNMLSSFPGRDQTPDAALSLSMSTSHQAERRLAIKTGQLHFYLDLEFAKTMTVLFEELSSMTNRDVPTEVPSPASSSFLKQRDTYMHKPFTVHDRFAQQVLDDLDLSMTYLQNPVGERDTACPEMASETNDSLKIDVIIPFLRVEARVPPPRRKAPRSGSLIVDIHEARFSNSGPQSRHTSKRPHFDDPELREWFGNSLDHEPLVLEMRQVVCAYAGLHQTKARSILILGTVSEEESHKPVVPLVVFKDGIDSDRNNDFPAQKSLLVRIPSIRASLDKPNVDGLQLWADDVSQFVDHVFSGRASGASTRANVSRTTSLLGSRYFTQRVGSGSSDNTTPLGASSMSNGSEFVVKAVFHEAFVRLNLNPSRPDGIRIFDVSASNLDALLEVKPERRDEIVVTLGISDLCVSKSLSSISAERTPIISRRAELGESKQASVRLAFRSLSVPTTTAKESKIKINLYGLSILVDSGPGWLEDLSLFAKSPPGAFETVVPNERTHVSASLAECLLRLMPPTKSSSMLVSLDDLNVSTMLSGDSSEKNIDGMITALSVFLTDKTDIPPEALPLDSQGTKKWTTNGYALLASIQNLQLRFSQSCLLGVEQSKVDVDGMLLNAHLCADTISGMATFASDLQTLLPQKSTSESGLVLERPQKRPAPVGIIPGAQSTLLRSIDEQAFLRQPVVGPMPDLIGDDLPNNPDYLDSSFSAAAGLRVLDDDDDESFAVEETAFGGGETIKILQSPIEVVENYYDNIVPSDLDFASEHGNSTLKVRAKECDIHLFIHDGYDWEKTRKDIQDEVKRVKKRLAKIRQLLSSGQSYDPNIDELNSVLFNSVYVGLDADAESLEPEALMAAIDLELKEEDGESESSWQSFKPNQRRKSEGKLPSINSIRLERAKAPNIEISLNGFALDFDQYAPDAKLISRLLFTIHNLRILDHMKSSTWSTFLTEMRTDSRGNIRESDSNMVRVELQMLVPFQGQTDQEARLKAKLLPLRLHVDQDALDFLKKFSAFKAADAQPSPPPENEIFFQHVEIFPVDIKLDYKPRRVDYRALKEGRTIELMNFFHFDGAEMTLRHITLKGITGWPRMFDTLNDLWTPDVKANQLVDVISGVSPIRSAVNVGSGVADLVLLPIAQYKKDGRIIRGLQKGTTSFVKSTAMEAIRLGARLATGTQVVLEQAESILGGQVYGQTVDTGGISGETLNVIAAEDEETLNDERDLISKYAEQPQNVREGVQDAYKTLSQNIKSAGQTILAVPMEVYERSGNEGPARAVIRAVPIAVLKPMIGASEAISKTLFGLHNTLDPQSQLDYEAKYKHR